MMGSNDGKNYDPIAAREGIQLVVAEGKATAIANCTKWNRKAKTCFTYSFYSTFSSSNKTQHS